MQEVLVIGGGDPPTDTDRRNWPDWDTLIVADSGLDHARRLDLVPTVVVGDLDSVQADSLAWARGRGIGVATHPAAKDETDLELALDLALRSSPDTVTVAGVNGGRVDHFLANLLLIASPRYAAIEMQITSGSDRIRVLHGPGSCTLHGRPGSLVSLLPAHGDAIGVSTDGLRYGLADETLAAGSPRGMSNEMLAVVATVSLRGGTLLVIEPGADR